MSIVGAINTAVDRATVRVSQMIRRGILKTITAAGFCQIETYDGEPHDTVELWQQFGMASRPADGTEAILLLVDALGEKPICIVTHSRSDRPPALAVGDAALYGKQESGGLQALVWTKADGDVDITAGSTGYCTLGGNASAGEFALKGESVKTKLDNLNTSIIGLGVAAGPDAAIINGMKAALTTFSGSASALLASKGKVF